MLDSDLHPNKTNRHKKDLKNSSHAKFCLLKKSFITGITILQPLYLLYIYAILIPNWGYLKSVELFNQGVSNKKQYHKKRKQNTISLNDGILVLVS